MMRVVAVCVLLSLCTGLWATGPVDPMTKEQVQILRLMVAAIAAQLVRILCAVDEEEIGPTLKAEIQTAIETMLVILEALGYGEPAVSGTRVRK